MKGWKKPWRALGVPLPGSRRPRPATTPEEREVAIARLNARQSRRNLFTNIGEREVRREVLRARSRA